MNPLLQLLMRYGAPTAGKALLRRHNLLGSQMDALPQGTMPFEGDAQSALRNMQAHQAAQNEFGQAHDPEVSPQKRIMDAFEHYKQSKTVELPDRSPQERINEAFGIAGMPPQAQPVPQAPSPPMQQLPLPPSERKFTELPPRNAQPAPQPAPAPVEPPAGLSWFQRNAMLQRDPETGAYLDPEMAQRAQRGLFG